MPISFLRKQAFHLCLGVHLLMVPTAKLLCNAARDASGARSVAKEQVQKNSASQDDSLTLQIDDEDDPTDADDNDIDDQEDDDDSDEADDQSYVPASGLPRRIEKIVVHGNQLTPSEAILSHIPYKVGEVFNPSKARTLISNLYFGISRFRNITLKGENVGADRINLHVIVEEKIPLKDINFVGNGAVPVSEMRKKIDFDVPSISEEELKVFAQQIIKLYRERGYNDAIVDTNLDVDYDGKAIATFTMKEGKASSIRRMNFIGNNEISDKELRSTTFSREDWLLGFLDRSGTFMPERLEGDKYMIEQLYQNRGYMQAKVIDIDTVIDDASKKVDITFEIEEGARYTLGTITASGHDIVPDELVVASIPLRPGEYYSRDRLMQAIKTLEMLWGNEGYIFAHIDPSIQLDEDTKTVSINFISELGKQVRLNRVTIRGNRKTRDKVIRRHILVEEGGLLSNGAMELTTQNVQSLGYFEQRDGVSWKIHRISEDEADLDLIVNEAKTGSFNVQAGFGGSGVDLRSPSSGLSVKGALADTNLFGMGIDFNIEASWAKDEQTVNMHLAQNWLFDKPLSGALDVYHKRPTYDELRNINPRPVNEKLTGFGSTFGFITPPQWPVWGDVRILSTFGVDDIHYEQKPRASIPGAGLQATADYQYILDREFRPGRFGWFANSIEQIKVNHPIHPSRGHRWRLFSKFTFPGCKESIAYYKMNLEGHWFTPLIDEYNLVFHIHGYVGCTIPFGSHAVPFGELYHIGGQNSVRGYLFGQIGPKFLGDTIGSKKAMFTNVELIFPITPDFNMKGVLFYDGGAGWDNPFVSNVSADFVSGNNFDYRHAVGFGLRLLQPMPVRIDWGFKIDPRSDPTDPERRETAYEVHFGMNYTW